MHISSLPTEFGIGDFGPEAYNFVDYLVDNGFKYWQILPLNQTGYGNSPYNPLSAFALNPFLISPELLFEDGLIDLPDIEAALLPRGEQVPYESVYKLKEPLLAKAADNYLSDMEISEYIENNALYLKPYLAYNTLCKLYGDDDWQSFRAEHRTYSEKLYDQLFASYGRMILQAAGIQALISDQVRRFKDYVNSRGLQLIGDLPLYLSYNSSEVWANQQLFELDEMGRRLAVAGVPPDAYSSDGQLWGNPIYRWDVMRQDGFQFFRDRMTHALEYLDLLRLDHFIGYVNYWSVPVVQDTDTGTLELPVNSMSGAWQKASPQEFFSMLHHNLPLNRFIAEDLGILNSEVCSFRDRFGFPGMIVLQFCFEESVPDVSQYPKDRFIYTGTHDNPTVLEWYLNLEPNSESRMNLQRFVEENPAMFSGLGITNPEDLSDSIHLVMMVIASESGCENVIFPLQDVLGLDSTSRMNVPGTALGNWQWRLVDFSGVAEALANVASYINDNRPQELE